MRFEGDWNMGEERVQKVKNYHLFQIRVIRVNAFFVHYSNAYVCTIPVYSALCMHYSTYMYVCMPIQCMCVYMLLFILSCELLSVICELLILLCVFTVLTD